MPDDKVWGVVGVTVVLDDRVVLDNVTLQVRPGTLAAVVGGDGAGKTTLLRTICGRVTPSAGTVFESNRRRIGYQPATSGCWANLTVSENMAVVGQAYGLAPDRFRQRQADLLPAAGLADAHDRSARQLSGEMRQKLGFSMAMLHQPDLLVLDEPSTGVDPVSRVELWALIADAAAKGAAVLMATTYLDEAERVHHVMVLDRGVALLQGTPDEVLADTPGTVTEVPIATDPARAWRRGRRVHQWHPGPPRPSDSVVSVDMEDAVVAAALAHRGEQGASVSRSVSPTSMDGDLLVEAHQLTKQFGSKTVVDDVTIAVAPGEIVGLIGANGAGKTTLIRMVLGLLAASAGDVVLLGMPPSRETRKQVG
jgi:ABC-2 type transport system ATP-binding protein